MLSRYPQTDHEPNYFYELEILKLTYKSNWICLQSEACKGKKSALGRLAEPDHKHSKFQVQEKNLVWGYDKCICTFWKKTTFSQPNFANYEGETFQVL